MMADDRHKDLISFENVTLRIRDRHILPATNWQIKKGQSWAVIGPNGSGKTTLLRAITGHTPVVKGNIRRYHLKVRPEAVGYVSFEQQLRLIAREQDRDTTRFFSGKFNDQLTAKLLIQSAQIDQPANNQPKPKILKALRIDHLLDRPLRALSNGECRKVLIGCAVIQSQGFLVLDEPFEGLDRESRKQLADSVRRLIQNGFQVILATHRADYILSEFSHVLGLKDGRIFCQGPRERIIDSDQIQALYDRPSINLRSKPEGAPSTSVSDNDTSALVVQMRNVTVQYSSRTVFKNLNWTVAKGENWAVTGPNGSGKTTLLQMITGDQPQAYANEIYLFGRRRGSGESIWEIKQRLGLISPEFQIGYRKPLRAFDAVLSGFFDSVGLYRRANTHQRRVACQWIAHLALRHLQNQRFDLLSYGEQRMLLLARAMVKAPELLVLDEPCQGLDPANRRIILACIDTIAAQSTTQILYVTHFPEELPACITHRFDLTESAR